MKVEDICARVLRDISVGKRKVVRVAITHREIRFISDLPPSEGVKVRVCLRDCHEDEKASGLTCMELLDRAGCYWSGGNVYPIGDCAVLTGFVAPYLFKWPKWLTEC